jgi:hypothetical protein
MLSSSDVAKERRVRRALARNGQRLWKISSRSSYSAEYGPCAIVDLQRNALVEWGWDLDELDRSPAGPVGDVAGDAPCGG